MLCSWKQVNIACPVFAEEELFRWQSVTSAVNDNGFRWFNNACAYQFKQTCKCRTRGWFRRNTFHLGENMHRPKGIFVADTFKYSVRLINLAAQHCIGSTGVTRCEGFYAGFW